MSNAEKTQKEDLKKLEDEAYFELMQIIAEALQMQDIELLDYRISNWKNKYKKLLDNPSPQFKKRVEFLLNQYYSSVTQYILSQIKFKEQKMIENQAKALRELYVIIRDTNDLPLLKKKVEKWQEKYPVSGFLKMYQKKVESYTRQKNLEQNAFEQDKAFKELVDITKINGTFKELKEKFKEWEKTYSINDKYTIDDFIKHQTEIKRYSSDEYLRSIAREEVSDEQEITNNNVIHDNSNETSNSGYSPLPMQAQAYSTLLAIAQKRNNVDEVFDWVYKNRNTRFNDKYKELILAATYLDYSPRFLQSMQAPEIDITKASLTLSEYKNMREIKRYSAISYFNLLLPPNKSFSNNFFNNYVNKIYSKSLDEMPNEYKKDKAMSSSEFMNSGIQIDLSKANQLEENIAVLDTSLGTPKSEENFVETAKVKKVAPEFSSEDEINSVKQSKSPKLSDIIVEEDSQPIQNSIEATETNSEITDKEITDKLLETSETSSHEDQSHTELAVDKGIIDEPQDSENADANDKLAYDSQVKEISEDLVKPIEDKNQPKETFEIKKSSDEVSIENPKILDNYENTVEPKEMDSHPTQEVPDHDTIVALSPMFFSMINNYSKQAVLVASIDQTTTRYVNSMERENEQSLDFHRSTDNSF